MISEIITWPKPLSKLSLSKLENRRLAIAFWFMMSFFGWRPLSL